MCSLRKFNFLVQIGHKIDVYRFWQVLLINMRNMSTVKPYAKCQNRVSYQLSIIRMRIIRRAQYCIDAAMTLDAVSHPHQSVLQNT